MGEVAPEERVDISTPDRQIVTVYLKEHPRARRISLRVDPAHHRIVLIKPRRTSKKAAIAFAQDKAGWLKEQVERLPKPRPFADGAAVPLRGETHLIRHCPEARRGVWTIENEICVSGDAAHLSRRVTDWYRAEARKAVAPLVHGYAETLGKRVTGITIRDTRSRWGSCTAQGKLSFSWRLIMTPPHVISYVVAHEVAHLCEMNHSARFWQTVDRLVEGRDTAAGWLKTHGHDLHRYGLDTIS